MSCTLTAQSNSINLLGSRTWKHLEDVGASDGLRNSVPRIRFHMQDDHMHILSVVPQKSISATSTATVVRSTGTLGSVLL